MRLFAVILLAINAYGASENFQLLRHAIEQSDLKAVRALLAKHADVNAVAADGWTALHEAALRDNLKVADLLIAEGANVTAQNRYGITPLSLACTNGSAAMIERLLKRGVDPNSTSEHGQSALMTAALTGKPGAVKVLLNHGAKVNYAEPVKEQTALMWAASEGNAETVEMLIEFGADVKAKSKFGFTSLLFAVRNAHRDVVKCLLAHGANVNDVGPDGTSALNMAVVNAYFELAAFLLDHGADPNTPDPRGSALHTLAWLRKPGSDGGAGVGRKSFAPPAPTGNMTALELAKVLLQHGANPNVRIAWQEKKFDKEGGTVKNPPLIQLGRHFLSFVGATPFYIAAQNGDAPMMQVLADGGADPKISTVHGLTPLMAAAGMGYWEGESPGPFTGCPESERLDAVKLALKLGNEINAHADFGSYRMAGAPEYTLLYYPLNMDELLDKGLGDPRWNGSTALFGAITSGQAAIVQYLVEQGADVNAKNTLGWTPLMLARGVFYANAKKEYPAAVAILQKALSGSQAQSQPAGDRQTAARN